MALVIEDGTGLANATSFVTLAEYRAFAEARGITVSDDDDVLNAQAINATDYMTSLESEYGGERLTDIQSLSWPRTGQYVYGVLIEDGTIPKQVKDFQFAVMRAINDGVNLFPTSAERALKRSKVGPLEKEWFDGDISPTVTYIDAALAPLLSSQAGFALTVRRI